MTAPNYFVLTDALALGKPGRNRDAKAVDAFSAFDAKRLIDSGKIAVLPPGKWTMAIQALLLLGMSQEEAAERVRQAREGTVGTV